MKFANPVVIDLENYETVIMKRGIDLSKYMKFSKMEARLVDLVAHMKEKAAFKIDFEKLDPKIVHELNEISNEDIKRFHKDNFARFHNYGDELQKESLLQ